MKMKDINNIDSLSNINTFVECGETIKVEDIKEEINEDPLSIQEKATRCEIENNDEIKEGGINDDPLCVQEIQNSEKNRVIYDVDIVEHKIEMDNYDQSSIY